MTSHQLVWGEKQRQYQKTLTRRVASGGSARRTMLCYWQACSNTVKME